MKHIVGINLGILGFYSFTAAAIRFGMNLEGYDILNIAFFMMCAIAIHVIALFIISMVKFSKQDKTKGKAFLLAALLVLLVGFSACTGMSMNY